MSRVGPIGGALLVVAAATAWGTWHPMHLNSWWQLAAATPGPCGSYVSPT